MNVASDRSAHSPSMAHTHPKYRPDIDGLRAIAVLSVVAFHAAPTWMSGGFIGVDIFFVISGFLITTILFKSLDSGSFSFADFYSRRIRRIFPALILVLIACYAFGWFVLLADEYNQLGKHVAAGAGFIANFILWSEAGYFDKSADTKPLLHLWSLGIEEQFYIIWPVLLWFAWKRNFNLLIITVVLAITSFAMNLKNVESDPTAAFYFPHTRFWELMCGSVLAWFNLYKLSVCQRIRVEANSWFNKAFKRKELVNAGNALSDALGALGLMLLFYGFWRIDADLSFPGRWAVIPVAGTALIIMAGPNAWTNRKVLSNKIAVWFGLISFPLYLWHWPVLTFIRIIEGDLPSRSTRFGAVLISVALAWLTLKLVETPLRFGKDRSRRKITALCGFLCAVGLAGFISSRLDYTETHTYNNVVIKRKDFEHAFGATLAWYKGKEDWLFLGNDYDRTVAKLKLAVSPPTEEIAATTKSFSKVAEAATRFGAEVALIIGPNKSTIYPEHLPEGLIPARKRYASFYVDVLKDVPNLTVYDPTSDLIRHKESEGYLYWKTDTHWNHKGAFVAFSGMARQLKLPIPEVRFERGTEYSGDLIKISKLDTFPLTPADNWEIVWKDKPSWNISESEEAPHTPFGTTSLVTNIKALSDKRVWVIGDSFTEALKPYFNATFKEVRYVGHWANELEELPYHLTQAQQKPDIIFIVRVERSF